MHNSKAITTIKRGQSYYDEPLYVMHTPKPEFRTYIALSISEIFKSKLPKPFDEFIGYERVRLNWIKP